MSKSKKEPVTRVVTADEQKERINVERYGSYEALLDKYIALQEYVVELRSDIEMYEERIDDSSIEMYELEKSLDYSWSKFLSTLEIVRTFHEMSVIDFIKYKFKKV